MSHVEWALSIDFDMQMELCAISNWDLSTIDLTDQPKFLRNTILFETILCTNPLLFSCTCFNARVFFPGGL